MSSTAPTSAILSTRRFRPFRVFWIPGRSSHSRRFRAGTKPGPHPEEHRTEVGFARLRHFKEGSKSATADFDCDVSRRMERVSAWSILRAGRARVRPPYAKVKIKIRVAQGLAMSLPAFPLLRPNPHAARHLA